MNSFCDICGSPSKLHCGSCRKVFYCSKDHQIVGWKAHKKCCQVAQKRDEFINTLGGKLSAADARSFERAINTLGGKLSAADARSFERAAENGRPQICKGNILPNYIIWQHFAAEKSAARAQLHHSCSYYTTDPAVKHAIMPALEKLKTISIRQMADEVNKIHWDRVLYATVVGQPYKTVSVHIIIEDVESQFMRLCLYAFPGDYTTLVTGTRIAVLAPYMKHSKDDPISGALMMRCDHPDGVRVFCNTEEWTEAQKLQGTGRCLPLAAGGFLAHKLSEILVLCYTLTILLLTVLMIEPTVTTRHDTLWTVVRRRRVKRLCELNSSRSFPLLNDYWV
jgi:hypothetical protein